MASSVSGNSSQLEGSEGGPRKVPRGKLENGAGWYFARKEIEENSPSRYDGIDLKKETYLCNSYCTFLRDFGMRFNAPQMTIATAMILCHRFYLRQSHSKNDRRTIATACMLLAGKVEETRFRLKDVIYVYYESMHTMDVAALQKLKKKDVYEEYKELILLGEKVVLATLGFDMDVQHPYKSVVDAIKKFNFAHDYLEQVAWNFVNDGLRTSLCLQSNPRHIAAGATFLASKFLKVKLTSNGDKVWWKEFDITPRQLEEISNQILELYEPNRDLIEEGHKIEIDDKKLKEIREKRKKVRSEVAGKKESTEEYDPIMKQLEEDVVQAAAQCEKIKHEKNQNEYQLHGLVDEENVEESDK